MAVQPTPSVALRAPPPPQEVEELQYRNCSPSQGELSAKPAEGVNSPSEDPMT
jgi:hypothetical protein